MKAFDTRVFWAILFMFVTTLCTAQTPTITIKSVTMQPSDNSAIEHVVTDINGDTCALLKIKVDGLEGLEFPNHNQYVETNYIDGIYYVNVPYTAGRKLDFQHKDYLSGTIDMQEYGYRRLKSGKTYLITLDAPRVNELKSSVTLKVEPTDATVIFNGERQGQNSNGIYEFRVGQGNYSYEVKKSDYKLKSGVIDVGKTEAKTMSIRLEPFMHRCQVKGNVSSAHVLIDNIDYGTVGTMLLPQGRHDIRIQADGYIDAVFENYHIASSMTIPFTLEKNVNYTHVHATPVTIISSASAVYLDNKKIEGWISGKPVMLMPGKYLLTDDNKSKEKIIVGSEPITVELVSK